MLTFLMVSTLWIVCGLLSILMYPHTSGKTDIRNGFDIIAIAFLWPFMLAAAYEIRSNIDLKKHQLRRNEYLARSVRNA